MKLPLHAVFLAGAFSLHPLLAKAQAAQPVPQCTTEVAGPDGRNRQAEQVARALSTQGCAAGSVIRMTNIQPLHEMTHGGLVGGGNYYTTLLCTRDNHETEGAYDAIQVVTCTYNGSDAKPVD